VGKPIAREEAMKTLRAPFSVARATALVVMLVATAASAQQPRDPAASFPSRVVRIAVQSGPGGPPDIRARQIAAKLEALWRQPVIVENRPGAAGLLALDFVTKSPADGYTLLLSGQGPFVVMPHLRKLPLDPIKEFVPVTQIGISPLILMVNPALAAHSVAELAAHGRRHPGKLNATHPGPGTTNQLALVLFERATQATTTQVPYKDGVGQSIIDLAAGRIDMAFDLYVSHGAYLRDGKLRALAVTGRERLAVLPDVPTFTEAGLPELQSVFIWGGFFVRSGTPRPVIEQLHRALVGVLQSPDVRSALTDIGSQLIANSPEEFAAVIRAEHARYGRLIAEAGIRLD
jgi:tripartite-type tricarboxylate transporter receptor subunit TctC